MKLILTKNLKGNEILAKSILTVEGNILLKAGVILTSNYIKKLNNYGIFILYITDNSLDDIKLDNRLEELKESALQSIPIAFNDLLTNNQTNIKESLITIENLIDYIAENGSVNTNLYEVKCYDDYTYIHCIDTCIMSVFLGNAMGYNKKEVQLLGISSIFHDIGKTKIPNSIINKKGKLTEEEFDFIKLHPIFGRDILCQNSSFCPSIINGVTQHHERIDKTGYPFGLKSNEICDFAKIITICDVFTAISANRSYRKRFAPNEAYEFILSNSNTMFDAKIVKKFKETFAIYPLGCCLKLTNGIEGYVVRHNNFFPDRPVIRVIYDKFKNTIPFYEIDLLTCPNLGIESIVLE